MRGHPASGYVGLFLNFWTYRASSCSFVCFDSCCFGLPVSAMIVLLIWFRKKCRMPRLCMRVPHAAQRSCCISCVAVVAVCCACHLLLPCASASVLSCGVLVGLVLLLCPMFRSGCAALCSSFAAAECMMLVPSVLSRLLRSVCLCPDLYFHVCLWLECI